MKKFIISILMLVLPTISFAGHNVLSSEVKFVYQLDSNETEFEFGASVPNICGSTLYRVKSPNKSVASRKFVLVTTAFITGGKIDFYDNDTCEGSRGIVKWIKLVK